MLAKCEHELNHSHAQCVPGIKTSAAKVVSKCEDICLHDMSTEARHIFACLVCSVFMFRDSNTFFLKCSNIFLLIVFTNCTHFATFSFLDGF